MKFKPGNLIVYRDVFFAYISGYDSDYKSYSVLDFYDRQLENWNIHDSRFGFYNCYIRKSCV